MQTRRSKATTGAWGSGVSGLRIGPCVVVVFEAAAGDGEPPSLGADALRHVRALYKGTYNAYGWIDEAPEDGIDPDVDVLVFAPRDAWQEVAETWGGHVESRGGI